MHGTPTLTPPTAATGSALSPSRIRALVVVIAITSGLLATIDGPAPTGDTTIDAVLTAVGVGLVTWLGAAALRWDAALITIVAGLATVSIPGAVVGVAVGFAGFFLPIRPGLRSLVNATLIAVALNLVVRSDLGVFLGLSTLVGLALAAYVAGIGFIRRSVRTRRVLAMTAITVAAIVFVSGFTFAALTFLAADDLRAGSQRTEDGLAALADGDLPTARHAFTAAAASFDAADERIGTPFTSLTRYVPLLAQHHRVATTLTGDAADAAALIADELARVDLDALTVTDGHIDVDRVRAIGEPLAAIDQRIAELAVAVDDLDNVWLLPPVTDRLTRLDDQLTRQRDRSSNALRAAAVAPALLGGDGPRTYFLAFATPAEARGSGGFFGNWAELTVNDGTIEMTAFGRSDDLNEAGDPATRRFPTDEASGLARWVTRYAPHHIASGPDGTTGSQVWKNINMSPDVATTARAIAALYPQSGGTDIDGVFVMDVYALARFLEFTGPIPLPDGYTVDGVGTVGADNAAEFLLNDQYDVAKHDRVDVLEDFSRAVVDALLTGSLPPPDQLVDALGPMVQQGRIAVWMADPDEQAVIEQLGMAGTLPVPDQGDALAIVFNNAVGNKIDYYLKARATYRVDARVADHSASATLEIELTNRAPAEGKPPYVIGNPIGLPDGTNRTIVSIFHRLPVTTVTLDGQQVGAEADTEAGYFVTSVFVTVPAGGTATLRLDMEGTIDVADGYRLVARTPPTVRPTPLLVEATWTGRDGHTATATQRQAEAGRLTVNAGPP